MKPFGVYPRHGGQSCSTSNWTVRDEGAGATKFYKKGNVPMTTEKRNRIFYWIATIMVLLPETGSGIPELFTSGSQAIVQTMQTLGYPLYLMKILGFSKILGAVAIVFGRFPKLKEWAYAGFTFELLGATASHLLAGDTVHAPFPAIFLGLLMVSYVLGNKLDEKPIFISFPQVSRSKRPKVIFSGPLLLRTCRKLRLVACS